MAAALRCPPQDHPPKNNSVCHQKYAKNCLILLKLAESLKMPLKALGYLTFLPFFEFESRLVPIVIFGQNGHHESLDFQGLEVYLKFIQNANSFKWGSQKSEVRK
jgi:hypothetical protein